MYDSSFALSEVISSTESLCLIETIAVLSFVTSEFIYVTHYEISNFGKKERFSKHNSSYWKYKHNLGIGPSAHSYNGEY